MPMGDMENSLKMACTFISLALTLWPHVRNRKIYKEHQAANDVLFDAI